MEPGRMDGGVEQSQTLMHTILKRETESDIILEAAALKHSMWEGDLL